MPEPYLPGVDPGRSAVLSPCGKYRYVLRRPASPTGEGAVNFILLNPSTADATADDPTVRRCVAFAADWGFAELVITNLFGYRATDPRVLFQPEDPVGPDNDDHLLREAKAAALVVCGWGIRGGLFERDRVVMNLLRVNGIRPHCLKTAADGSPGHPLYLPGSVRPVPWEASL